jgi:hypothetical protein
MEYKCVQNELYINILDKHYHCTKRYLEIEDFGTIKCPLKALICHPKYNCKFGCVERYE